MGASPLYAGRAPIFPRRVSGRFRQAKWALMAGMLGLYWVTPWLRWHRGAGLPDQAVLIDLSARRFYVFGIEIWPHEFYIVAGLLIMAGFGLFLLTAAAGRVWCGYACPQTVWTDLFMQVERWVEGDRNARIRLHRAPWGGAKIAKRALKWGLWAAISVATGGAWVFYFADAPGLARGLATGTAPFAAWATIALLSATTFAFAGFAREQICIYACPWPRIQAAMMDRGSLTVAYRDWRGEPRGKPGPGDRDSGGSGDCIDCMACVSVCPMGIDIRDGQQLACITCGLCIDACDGMMDRLGRPRGLVGYLSLADEAQERQGGAPHAPWRALIRPRVLVQAGLWAAVGVAMLAALALRPALEIAVTPARNPLFVTEPDGTIRNIYTLRLRNRAGRAEVFTLATDAPARLSIEGATPPQIPGPQIPAPQIAVPADATAQVRVYLDAAPGSALAVAGQVPVTITATGGKAGTPASAATVFNGAGVR